MANLKTLLLAIACYAFFPELVIGFTPRDRDCICERDTIFCENKKSLFKKQIFNKRVKDNLDDCDYRCAKECETEIKEDLYEAGATQLSDASFGQLCREASETESINRGGGICLINRPSLQDCKIQDDKYKIIKEGICCRYCSCKLVYFNRDGTQNQNFKVLKDSTAEYDDKDRFFPCDGGDNDRDCETYCRKQMAGVIDYKELEQPNIYVYEPAISKPATAEKICQLYKKQSNNDWINEPGMSVAILFSTGTDPKTHLQKEISLNNVCCKRSCTCSVIYRDPNTGANVRSFALEKDPKETKAIFDQYPIGYNCENELKSCMQDCREATGLFLDNENLEKRDIPFIELKPFDEFNSAARACARIATNDYTREKGGLLVYLKYSVSSDQTQAGNYKNSNPYTQEYLLGRVCCERYLTADFFPIGYGPNCENWWTSDQIINGK